jgi:hypothetical protein
MVRAILPIRNNVFKFITDSILSDVPLDDYIKVSNNLGEFKPDKNNGKTCKVFKNGRKTQWIN